MTGQRCPVTRAGSLTIGFLGIAILVSIDVPVYAQDEDSIPMPGAQESIPQPKRTPGFLFPELELRGYVENTFTGEYLKDEGREQLLNATRTRINLSGRPLPCCDVGIGVVAPLYTGTTQASLAPYLPRGTQEELIPPDPGNGLPGARDLLAYELDSEIYVQEAFGTMCADRLRVRVGRQKFYTGTGYSYNPIDLFNVQDPLDPTYEIDGFDALLAIIHLPRQMAIQGLVRFADRLNRMGYLARLKTHVSGWDLALQYTRLDRERLDWETINTTQGIQDISQGAPLESFSRQFRWQLVGGEFAGQLGGLGFYGEGGYVFVEERDDPGALTRACKDHGRFLLGIDHTFESQLYFLVEYLRFGQGRTERSQITLNDRMAAFTGEILSANRDNLFAGFSYPLTELSEISLYSITALNDPSAIVNPWLEWDVYSGVKLWLTAYIPVGEEESQNGRVGPSGFVRLKLHF